MQKFLIKNSFLKGKITIPPSKSHTLRAILFGSMGKGKSVIHHYLPSPDTQAMIEACRLFGASIEVYPDKIAIEGLNGKIKGVEDVIQAGNSGIVLRFCSALSALAHQPAVITGDFSIRHHRPMQPLLNALAELGVKAVSMRGDGFAPVIIQGPLQGGQATVYGADSQPVSALLIASAFAGQPTEFTVIQPGEKPWVALTLDWFDRLGIRCENRGFEHYRLFGNARFEGFEYFVPGDLSTAAFPLAAALVTQSEIALHNVDLTDSQGDKELIYLFEKMGGKIEIDSEKKRLHVKKSTLTGVEADINNFVDGITILAAVACFAEGETVIRNGAVAKQKECNRIECMAQELTKMGGQVSVTPDGLHIRKSPLKGAEVHSHGDHRMVLALAVAAMGAKGETKISSVECIAKTFPTFLAGFNALGANIAEVS
jgi:3-phosphoshikimate 1-carboxyvinyltransferase